VPIAVAGARNKAEAGDDGFARSLWWTAGGWWNNGVLSPPEAGQRASVRWTLFESDPSLNQSLISEGTTISQLFDQDKWERHRLADRYWRHAAGLFTSTVFQRILRPILAFVLFAAAFAAYSLHAVPAAALAGVALPTLALHPVPLSLLSPTVGLLLVFRINHSYARFLEGRLLWGACVRHCRDLARLLAVHLPDSPARRALLAHVVAYAWLLKAHLRAGRTR
jgi:hypothetical protein